MSIRFRLTLLYSAILGLTLIGFSTALYFTLGQVTLTELKATLKNETQRILATETLVLDTRSGLPTYVQTVDFTGTLIKRTSNLGNNRLPLSDSQRVRVLTGEHIFEPTVIDGERLLVYSLKLRGEPTIFQVARSLEGRERSLEALRRLLIIGSSAATVVAFGIGWLLAGAALRPINRITHTAHAIGVERDFGRRVDHVGPQDEIGRLVTTFNTMLTALQGAYKQEAQALQAQRRFVADASHELRTPLTTIRGNIALLQREPPISPADRTEVLSDMADESERMSRLVHDLLVLARADAGRTLRADPIRLKPLIEDICRKATVVHVERTISCESLNDVAVIGDHDALTQVLLILLDNALKFTPAAGTVTITTAVGDGQAAVSVRDTGIGIAPHVVPHIFERFYRGDSARTGTGAGLGLAIAHTLVVAQRGSISVESEVGAGSVFTVKLPLASVDAVAAMHQRADTSVLA